MQESIHQTQPWCETVWCRSSLHIHLFWVKIRRSRSQAMYFMDKFWYSLGHFRCCSLLLTVETSQGSSFLWTVLLIWEMEIKWLSKRKSVWIWFWLWLSIRSALKLVSFHYSDFFFFFLILMQFWCLKIQVTASILRAVAALTFPKCSSWQKL